MEPMPLTSGNLGRLQQEDTVSQREEGTSTGSPTQSPVRMGSAGPCKGLTRYAYNLFDGAETSALPRLSHF